MTHNRPKSSTSAASGVNSEIGFHRYAPPCYKCARLEYRFIENRGLSRRKSATNARTWTAAREGFPSPSRFQGATEARKTALQPRPENARSRLGSAGWEDFKTFTVTAQEQPVMARNYWPVLITVAVRNEAAHRAVTVKGAVVVEYETVFKKSCTKGRRKNNFTDSVESYSSIAEGLCRE